MVALIVDATEPFGRGDQFAIDLLREAVRGKRIAILNKIDLLRKEKLLPLIQQYKANLNAYCLSLKDYITRRGGTYLFTSTEVPFDTLVLNYLRERGLLG